MARTKRGRFGNAGRLSTAWRKPSPDIITVGDSSDEEVIRPPNKRLRSGSGSDHLKDEVKDEEIRPPNKRLRAFDSEGANGEVDVPAREATKRPPSSSPKAEVEEAVGDDGEVTRSPSMRPTEQARSGDADMDGDGNGSEGGDDGDDEDIDAAKLEFTYVSDDDHAIDAKEDGEEEDDEDEEEEEELELSDDPPPADSGRSPSLAGLSPRPREPKVGTLETGDISGREPRDEAQSAQSAESADYVESDDHESVDHVSAPAQPLAVQAPPSPPLTESDELGEDGPKPADGIAAVPEPASSPPPDADEPDELEDESKPVSENSADGVLGPGEDLEPATLTPLCLPDVDCEVDNYWANLFFRFCAERHAMYTRRAEGVPRDKLTNDETMTAIHIGNIYRQLDPSSINMRDNIIAVGDQSLEEICFRVFLFCMFYLDTTWDALCKAATGGVPSWKHFEKDLPAMEVVLHQMAAERKKLWRGAFQLVPPTVIFAKTHRNSGKDMANYAASLRLVMVMMKAGIPARLAKCTYAVDASYVLHQVPTLGGFLGLNVLCFLNDSPHFKWMYRDFATCGPGSRKFMQRMFGKRIINSVAMEDAGLRWLTDNQWRYWARLDVDPPHEWEHGLRPGMRVLDVENALCWAHRYVNAFEDKGTRSLADEPAPSYDPEVTEKCGQPAWCVEKKWLDGTSRAPWDAEGAEADARVDSIGDDDIYEIDKVVARLGSTADADGRFRVRWTGWTPEWDTWERASSLREDAEEALEEWLELERNVRAAVEHVKKNKLFKWPDGRAVAKAETYTPERDVETQAATRAQRAARRADGRAVAKAETYAPERDVGKQAATRAQRAARRARVKRE